MVYRTGMLVFMLLNGASAFLAIFVAAATAGQGGAAAYFLTALCVYLIVIHSVIMLSGLAGFLTVGGVAALLGVATAAAWWARARGEERSSRDGAVGDEASSATWYLRLAAILAGALWTWPHFMDATRLWIWDDYTYHVVYPVLWLRGHAIAAVTPIHAYTMQAWYPLSASAIAAWFMLPFYPSRGEALAWVSLTGPLYAAIIVCGAAALLTRLGCRPGAWLPVLVLVATSPRIAIMASSFSDADLAQAAVLFAAFVFAVPPGEDESIRRLKIDTGLAALLSGIAVGIKVSALIPGLVVLTMLALRAAAAARSRAVAGTVISFALAWTVTGGYWYARNLFHEGNPLYPAAFFIWPGATFPETRLSEYAQRYGLARTVRDALAIYLNWPLFHAAMALIGVIGLAGRLLWRGRSLSRAQAYFAGGALVMAVAIILSLPAMPFSAGNAMTFRSGFIHWDSMRYVGLVPILGWVALAFLVDAGSGAVAWRMLAAVLIGSASLMSSPWSWLRSPALLVALAASAVLLSRIGIRNLRWRSRRHAPNTLAATALVLVVMGTVLWRHDAKAGATAQAIYQESFFGEAAAALDRHPSGTRVAVFGDQWIFPTFGSGDHLVSLRLDRDGRLATAPVGDAMEPGDLRVSASTFLANLKAAAIDTVVVVHLPHPGRSAEWPAQQRALEASPRARLIARGQAVAVWDLREGPNVSSSSGRTEARSSR
jgi:hypothetical protein